MITSTYNTGDDPFYDWLVLTSVRQWQESESGQKLDNMLAELDESLRVGIMNELWVDRV